MGHRGPRTAKLKDGSGLRVRFQGPFFQNTSPSYEKYLWIDCDAWVNDWKTIENIF
jgi:hypothetical protein